MYIGSFVSSYRAIVHRRVQFRRVRSCNLPNLDIHSQHVLMTYRATSPHNQRVRIIHHVFHRSVRRLSHKGGLVHRVFSATKEGPFKKRYGFDGAARRRSIGIVLLVQRKEMKYRRRKRTVRLIHPIRRLAITSSVISKRGKSPSMNQGSFSSPHCTATTRGKSPRAFQVVPSPRLLTSRANCPVLVSAFRYRNMLSVQDHNFVLKRAVRHNSHNDVHINISHVPTIFRGPTSYSRTSRSVSHISSTNLTKSILPMSSNGKASNFRVVRYGSPIKCITSPVRNRDGGPGRHLSSPCFRFQCSVCLFWRFLADGTGSRMTS